MADEAVTNGKDDEVLDMQDVPLESVDLNRKLSQDQKHPVLQFADKPKETGGEEESMTAAMGETSSLPMSPTSPNVVEGTKVQTARQRSRSGGANFKEWSSHQLKITKQMVQERFGSGMRTVDPELERRIEGLKDTQKKYSQLIFLATQFQSTFVPLLETQKSMAEHFAFMSVKAPELSPQFHYNAETQKVVSRNGETLLAALKYFVSNMQTVCSKTMEDTLLTVKTYETARLSYDAYRTEREVLQKQAATSQKAASNLESVNAEFMKHRNKFEQLRQDVDIKLKLLDENKLKVTHKQLFLLQEAFAAYFSSNHSAVDALLIEFKEKLGKIEDDPPAWLEDLPSRSS